MFWPDDKPSDFWFPLTFRLEVGLLGDFNICRSLMHTRAPITGNLRPGAFKKTGCEAAETNRGQEYYSSSRVGGKRTPSCYHDSLDKTNSDVFI